MHLIINLFGHEQVQFGYCLLASTKFCNFHTPGLGHATFGVLQKHVIFIFQAKCKFQEVFNQVATYLTLRETEYFGLAFIKGL